MTCLACFSWLCGNPTTPKKNIVDTGSFVADLNGIRLVALAVEKHPDNTLNHKIDLLYRDGQNKSFSYLEDKTRMFKEYKLLKRALLPSKKIKKAPNGDDFVYEAELYKKELHKFILNKKRLEKETEMPLPSANFETDLNTTINKWNDFTQTKVPAYYTIKHREFLATVDVQFQTLKERSEKILAAALAPLPTHTS